MLLGFPIETKDLILRSLVAADSRGPYADWMRDEEVVRYLEVRFAAPDSNALERYIIKMNDGPDDLLLGLFPKTDPRRHIGNIKLGPIDRRHGTAALGILIGAKEFWGQGLANQAVAGVAEYGFAALELDRIEAGFYAENVGSQRAFSRAGFVEEGRLTSARRCGTGRTDEILMARLRNPRRS